MIFDRERPGSLAATLALLQRVASKVRDRISVDMWRALSHLMVDLMADLTAMAQASTTATDAPELDRVDARGVLSDVLELLDAGISRLAAFSGLVAENLTRGQSLDLPRHGPQARAVCSRCPACSAARWARRPARRARVLEALLEIADSSMTYRRRYLSMLQAAPVLDLLLADETNPRSLAFQLVALAESIDRLPRDPALPGRSTEQRLVLANLTEVRLADLDALARADESGRRARLESLLARLEADLPVLSEVIAASYFSHLQTSRHLGSQARVTTSRRGSCRERARGDTMLYKSIHTTIYDYVEPVSLCHNVFHLTARSGPWQTPAVERAADQPAPVGDDRADRLLRQHGDLRHDRGAAPAS